jgi:2'-5' RNA ligase
VSALPRLFFGLPVPESAHGVLVAERARLEGIAKSAALTPRWSAAEDLHVTTKFVGSVPLTALESVRAVGAAVASSRGAVFTTLGAASVFGAKPLATVLFVAVLDPGALAELASALDAGVAAFGIAREKRPFVPHVTLANFGDPVDPARFLEGAAPLGVSVTFDRLCLYESETPGPSRYTIRDEWPLTGRLR